MTAVLRIPDDRRVHGPVTRSVKRRVLTAFGVLCLIGLAPVALNLSPPWQAFGLGLVLPGGGFWYTQDVVFAVIWALGFPIGLFVWWGCGFIGLTPALWFGAAVLAATRTGDDWQGARWAVPAALVGVLALGLFWQRLRFARLTARGRAMNQRLVRAHLEPTVAPFVPQTLESSPEDLAALRYALDLALQPLDRFDGFTFIDQFREGAVRYQLNFIGYAAAMSAYTRTPAFTGYLAQAQRNVIEKMRNKGVWRYWAIEHLWGDFRWKPDPVSNENVMYSGYFGLMLGLYETVTGDARYHESGALSLRWNADTAYPHDYGTITDALVDNMRRSAFCLFPCEPNWIYPFCNTFAINSMLCYDRLRGTGHYEKHADGIRQAFEAGDFLEPDGRIIFIRSRRTGLQWPITGKFSDMIMAYWLNPALPDIARRSWWLARDQHLDPVDRPLDMKLRFWDKVDPGDYKPFRDAFTRITVVLAAREMGDEQIAQAFLGYLDEHQPRLESAGARKYGGMSVYSNLSLLLARFGRANAMRQLVTEGFPRPWREGPVLAEAAYPDVLVARAVSDGADLQLVLRPGAAACRTSIRVERLAPHRTYNLRGAVQSSILADHAGSAVVDVDLESRHELRVTPSIG